jgi:hypothetical protein
MTPQQRQQIAEAKVQKIKVQHVRLTDNSHGPKAEISTAIGFRKVIDMLLKHQKPLIGHNMFADLVYTYDQFIEVLPHSGQVFKEKLRKLFPLYVSRDLLS